MATLPGNHPKDAESGVAQRVQRAYTDCAPLRIRMGAALEKESGQKKCPGRNTTRALSNQNMVHPSGVYQIGEE